MAKRDLTELILDPEDEYYRGLIHLSDSHSNVYAKLSDQSGYLHRKLTNCPKGFTVDHINGDSLDNRKANLRVVSHVENCRNKDDSYRSSVGYQGIRLNRNKTRYQARITANYKEYYIGTFDSLEQAVKARALKEVELWGVQPRREGILNE